MEVVDSGKDKRLSATWLDSVLGIRQQNAATAKPKDKAIRVVVKVTDEETLQNILPVWAQKLLQVELPFE